VKRVVTVTMLDRSTDLRDRLLAGGLLFATGVDGLYGRSAVFQDLVDSVDRLVALWGTRLGATTVHLPPLLARSTFDATGYLQSFPDLVGAVQIFDGDDSDHAELIRRASAGEDWSALLRPSEVVLAPACCHGLYPMLTGRVPDGGGFYDVRSFCFRHEPSTDPMRMQAFHQHDIVCVGDPGAVERFRDEGLDEGRAMLGRLGLDLEIVPANDPFFGRLGAVLAAGQRDEGLKLEGVAHVHEDGPPSALMSGNCHRDHFGQAFSIETASGTVAHSACVGFGADRVAIALLAAHGLDPGSWPGAVLSELR